MENALFDFDVMAHPTPGNATEEDINIQIAMSKLRQFVMTGANQAEAETAFAYLRQRFPRLKTLADQMQLAFIRNDYEPRDQKRRIGRRVYNELSGRLSDMRIAE